MSLTLEKRRAFSIPEAARMLGISRATVYRMLKEGQIQTIKIGSRRLVPASSIDDVLTGRAK